MPNKPKIKAKHLGIIQSVIERQPDKALIVTVKDSNIVTSVHGITQLDDLLSIVGVSLYSYYAASVPVEQRKQVTYAKFLAVVNNAFLLEAGRSEHADSTSAKLQTDLHKPAD